MQKRMNYKGYISQCCYDLVNLLIECISRVNIDEEDEDDDELSVALSAGCCLAAIALINGDMILEQVIDFVSQNISNVDWKLRYSSLLALGAITEGPDRIKFLNKITPGLPNLLTMFNDGHGKVREAISWVMSKICENHSDVITNQDAINSLIPIFLNSLKDKPRISN